MKRGLYKALGAAIGFITGNMNLAGNERIKTNQIKLQEQIKHQYNISLKNVMIPLNLLI